MPPSPDDAGGSPPAGGDGSQQSAPPMPGSGGSGPGVQKETQYAADSSDLVHEHVAAIAQAEGVPLYKFHVRGSNYIMASVAEPPRQLIGLWRGIVNPDGSASDWLLEADEADAADAEIRVERRGGHRHGHGTVEVIGITRRWHLGRNFGFRWLLGLRLDRLDHLVTLDPHEIGNTEGSGFGQCPATGGDQQLHQKQ